MTKNEYILNRFKADFLKYSLMQEDSLLGKEIADKVYDVSDLEWFFEDAMQELVRLGEKHLSFDKVMVDGKLANELPEDLDYGVKDQIKAEFEAFLDKFPVDQKAAELVAQMERQLELQTWANGVCCMSDAINMLLVRISVATDSYRSLASAPVDEADLLEKYKAAKENTLMERVRGNNIDDIAEYRGALVDYVKVSCKNMLYDKMKTVLKTVASSPVFETLRQNFDDLVEYSRELKASIVSCGKNPDWDKEYDKMIPTDFFFRNLAEVTPEQAFQMSLLNMFAANEEWMVEKGMLVDGKLKVYTGAAVENVKNLLSLMA